MSERSDAIGLASASSGLPPPNSSAAGLAMNDQVTASRRPNAASARLAVRVRFCSSVSTGAGTPSFRRGSGAGGTRSRPAMRTICSTMSALPLDVWPPARDDRLAIGEFEAEPLENRFAFGLRNVDAEQPFDLAVGKVDRALRRRRIAGDDHPRRLAAAQVDDQMRRQLQAGNAEGGIDAALEAVARVGHDGELAAGLGGDGRIPQRAFDQHVAGRARRSRNVRRPSRRRSNSTPLSSAIATMLSSSA